MKMTEQKKSIRPISEYIAVSPIPLLGILGGLSASTAETLTFGFDNIKTRM